MKKTSEQLDKLLRNFEVLAVDIYTTSIQHPDFIDKHKKYEDVRNEILEYMEVGNHGKIVTKV